MRGMIGGILTGGLVSVLGLGAASVVSELPAGVTPPEAPLVDAPVVDEPVVEPVAVDEADAPNTPVGAISIDEPLAPALPEGEALVEEPDAPQALEPDAQAPRADTDPLDEPDVTSIEGALEAPDAPQSSVVVAQPVDPVLPNPQSLAPQTPVNEADLTVSTTPAQPTIVIEPEVEVAVVEDTPEPVADPVVEAEDTFIVDLGANAAVDAPADVEVTEEALADASEDEVLASAVSEAVSEEAPAPRLQLQGGDNNLLGDRATGVTIRRPGASDEADESATEAPVEMNALADYAVDAGDVGSKPLLSIILIDDGTMSAASAALSGLPFAVTIALDPSTDNVGQLMEAYRAEGFEVVVLAKVPEGAVPSDVEITFESIFSTLTESVGVLDIGNGGLQSDRAVTEQAMEILASQGRGFVTASQGLNMAGRAAEQAGVPSVVIYRDLDNEDQDARVVRRFVDQAAFRARQESGVVLVGRVRPDTISALILWGTANQDDQVAMVPLSAVLNAQ